MKRTLLGIAPLTLALSMFVGCGGDDAPSGEAGETAGDGDGDQTTTGDGDGDGDGDPATGDGDGEPEPEPEPDTDMDGFVDSVDNCPEIANPNQLDFDGNGLGNVCDVQVFNTVGGTLNSTANADAGIGGSCSIPMMLEVTSGVVQIQLDDDAAVAAFEISQLEFADVLDKECALAFGQTASVSLKEFSIANNGDPFPVTIPHSQAAHDAGSIAGDSDVPYPILATAVLEASINGGEPMPSDLMLEGETPVFTANITDAGQSGTLAWADAQFVVAMDTFMVTMPVNLDITFELDGLVGTLTLAP